MRERRLGLTSLGKFSKKAALTSGASDRIGDGVLMGMRLVSRSITEIYDHRLRDFGLTAVQFILLSMIRQRPITRAYIARLQHLDRSTLTRNLKTVLSKGWVEEVRDNADGRSRPIALTESGRELLREAEPNWIAAEIEATALLGTDGTTTIINVADQILKLTEPSAPTVQNDEQQASADDSLIDLPG